MRIVPTEYSVESRRACLNAKDIFHRELDKINSQRFIMRCMEKDFESFRLLMLNRTASIIPRWKDRKSADFGITLVEVLAYVADVLSYYQDAVATEASLGPDGKKIFVNKYIRLLKSSFHQCYRSKDAEISLKSLDDTMDPNGENYYIKEKDFGIPLLDNSDSASPIYVWLLSVHSYQPSE